MAPRSALGAPAVVRRVFAGGALLLAVLAVGCDPGPSPSESVSTEAICRCRPSQLRALAPRGATFELSGGTCTGTCQAGASAQCELFVVVSEEPTTCALRVKPARGAPPETLEIVFSESACCGVTPDTYEQTFGE